MAIRRKIATLAPLVGPGSGDLVLPRGVINAKVEGKIDNSEPQPPLVTDPNQAFFARVVHLTHGAVIPPVVPYAPFRSPTVYHKGQECAQGIVQDRPSAANRLPT